ncbi:Serine/threonine phosphatase stp [Sporomusa ovata DSM 2662]|uniref:Protein serine/threonine phosphatase PrpC, regulation of stationary phase n=1 Tax=Sporomusa ovata TaxID=2378 RepID=A0A0U1L5Z8_9FIRM|nr:Stp1/IreP family PP2C-type Ser/Thr phosphatase [Sporomusa ovata]EQB25996.1 protein phosphatase PrpC [Sporomusa ovata DSM 2662]CQR74573.1 Protein serine/threonine phosphatase PrpC, regulation of stationary phase [Sporomusa ovata]
MLAFAQSDIGMVRKTNEDSYVFLPPHLFVVADGMGGHVAGEIASNIGANTIQEYIERNLPPAEWQQSLQAAIVQANTRIYQMSQAKIECQGMGTTVTAVYLDNEEIYWGHVGDSRLYLIRENKLHQITNDHSLVWELMQNGSITSEEAQAHPHRNILTRAVGTSDTLAVDSGKFLWQSGDNLLLCTDGLTNMLSEETILNICLQPSSPQTIINSLVDQARQAGGYDNITAILLQNRD